MGNARLNCMDAQIGVLALAARDTAIASEAKAKELFSDLTRMSENEPSSLAS